MISLNEQPAKRESRLLWAVTEGDAVQVLGYSCAPTSPNYWWCPKVGFSAVLGGHLFETEKEAVAVALKECSERLDLETKSMQRLEKRLAKLK